MDRTERFYLIDRLLQARYSTPISLLMEELGVSRSTVKRDLTYLRERLYAPIIWDAIRQGYRYAEPVPGMARFSLPGLWFNSSELHALLTMEHLLKDLQPGLLEPHVEPLRSRVRKLLNQGERSVEELVRRIRVFHGTGAPIDADIFQTAANAVLTRQQIIATHRQRGTNKRTERYISPQRLIFYRDSWYLDGWCHLRDGLRTFHLRNLSHAELSDRKAVEIDNAILDAELTVGFGIFAGTGTQQAVLRFSTDVSRWVAEEQWHSNQEATFDRLERLVLTVPYSNDPELLMRILQYGPEVEVLEPSSLREKVAERLSEAASIYQT